MEANRMTSCAAEACVSRNSPWGGLDRKHHEPCWAWL